MIETLHDKLRDVFIEGGLLSSRLPNFEYREEQVEMAEAVFDTLLQEKNLIVEAGTGVGKSLAYLIPLVMWLAEGDNERAIVSTYTKALQKQLFEKELPFVKKHIFPHLRFALSFGSDNYVCLRRLEQSRQYGLFDRAETESLSVLLDWVSTTATGLRDELNPDYALWQKVKRESDMCLGRECRQFTSCFFQTAKALERTAHIIITNHHLFFAHVASNYNVLPDVQHVIFDEAHEIEGIAADYLGIEVSNIGLKYLLDSIISQKSGGLLLRLKWLDSGQLQEISALAENARKRGERYFLNIHEVLGDRRSLRIEKDIFPAEDFIDALSELTFSIENLRKLSGDDEEQREIEAIAQRVLLFRESLKSVSCQELEDYLYWISRDNRVIRSTATPLNVSDIMNERVFNMFSPVILTSATLCSDSSFDFIKNRTGLYEADTRLFASPFDFKKQGLVYIPDHLADPNTREYRFSVAEEVESILKSAQGRTMVLFTSYSLLYEVEEMINPGYPVLRQGDMDNYTLLEEFQQSQPRALFGTYTFWQGVDLQGDILKCVVITKLPFAVPTEPIHEARMEKIAHEGGDPFYGYQVPNAVITFKQGFGRLIRSKTDRGVVAVLDSRILKKPYGKYFLRSLPEIEIVKDFKKIRKFLK